MRRTTWLGLALAGAMACAGGERRDIDPDLRDAGEDGPDSGLDAPDSGQAAPDAGQEIADAGHEPADAGHAPGPANGCGAPGLLLCDDFETATAGSAPDAARWKLAIFQGQGSIAVDDAVARSGTKSVHVTALDDGGYRSVMFTTTAPFPRPDNTFYVRFLVRSKNGMAPGHSSYFSAGDLGYQRQLRLGFNDSQLDANLTHPSSEWEVLSGQWGNLATGVRFTPGRWYCVEALYDGAGHELRAWVDGSEIAGLHTKDWNKGLTSWSPTYELARFGFETYHGEKGEVWYDDVALGTQRIGCPEE